MNKIYLCNSRRGLLIFLLMNNFLNEEITYICLDKVSYLNFLPGKKIFLNEFDIINKRDALSNIFKRNLLIKRFRKKYGNILKEIEKEKIFMYGLDHDFLAKELFYKEKLILLEDGTMNYVFFDLQKKQSLKNKIKSFLKYKIIYFTKILFGIKFRKNIFGSDKSVKKIYLTGITALPERIKNKVEIVNLKELWEVKKTEEKIIILKVFGVNIEYFSNMKKIILLITQPLSEDKVISEKEKIEIYSKILKKYPKEEIVIKCHPREITDYKLYFPGYKILKDKYPVEILELIGIPIEKVITLFSTAAFEFNEKVEIDFYGTEVNRKLFEHFGSQDNLKIRNSFL